MGVEGGVVRELSLFTGAGGGVLGSLLLGWETIGYVEWDKYCQQVIAARIADGCLPVAPSLATFVSSYSPVQPQSIEDLRMWLAEAFPASPSASPEKEPAPTIAGICGQPQSPPSALWNPDTRSWRTYQASLLADTSAQSWETWPKAGMTHDGAFYPRPSWERRINEIGSGLWPTASTQEPGWVPGGSVEVVDKHGNPPAHANQRWYDKNTGRVVQKGLTQVSVMFPTPTVPNGGGTARSGKRINEIPSLQGMASRGMWPTPTVDDANNVTRTSGQSQSLTRTVQMLPTPTVQDAENNGGPSQAARNSPPLNSVAGGKLNPDWVEWLMGWPIAWSALEPLEMGKFRQWRQQHGDY